MSRVVESSCFQNMFSLEKKLKFQDMQLFMNVCILYEVSHLLIERYKKRHAIKTKFKMSWVCFLPQTTIQAHFTDFL